ncbi:MAG: hypothetical protein ABGX14_02355 [bacterium]|jgi:hypothetical protein|nr:MAG: hypothetical protein COA72_06770 [Candidatus Neomarinimicrobiota bacterium]PCJ48525.1 MAG: hypothetical protein COA72_05155 [Candidatus Neomarinimicrobiota bacterium]HIA83684.1 hypothetical protein [Candidatus Neomarinimicrobiota bacterium]|tara:strand:- start:528 stop:848 length:321 start_codon:yes stop_codon:yes gene_type:complete
MNHQKNLIYGLVVAAGFILVWIIYADQGIDPKPEIARDETPLILVDGKVPPKLSNFVAHMQYIDESTCLKCHATEREMNFGSGPMMVKKMPHEFRENCVSCHILPK